MSTDPADGNRKSETPGNERGGDEDGRRTGGLTTAVNVDESVAPRLSHTEYVTLYVVSTDTVGNVPRARRVDDENEIPDGRPLML